MLNIIGPFGAFDKTVTFVKAVLFVTFISTYIFKISSVALCICTLVSSVMFITSSSFAKNALVLLLCIVTFATKDGSCIVVRI